MLSTLNSALIPGAKNTGRIATEYVNSGTVYWYKIGRIAFVQLYDIVLKSGINTNNVAIICHDVPSAIDNFTTAVPILSSGSIRVNVTNDGKVKPWFNGTLEYSCTIQACLLVYLCK